jgi:hypothetical protein
MHPNTKSVIRLIQLPVATALLCTVNGDRTYGTMKMPRTTPIQIPTAGILTNGVRMVPFARDKLYLDGDP